VESAEGDATSAERPASTATAPIPPRGKPPARKRQDSSAGSSYVGPVAITALAVAILAAIILTVYSLVALWPPNSTSTAPTTAHVLGLRVLLDRDQQLFVVVALAGVIGGLIHSARSVYWYVGNRKFRRSWILMYLALPFIGGALAVLFYLILRGGLITGQATAQVNVFGFTAIAALAGLFSSQGAEKLQQIFSILLLPAEKGKDNIASAVVPIVPIVPIVQSIEPQAAAVGAIVVIHGENLSESTSILFENAIAPVLEASAQMATAQVPAGASTGPVRLIVGDRVVSISGQFRVEP
jgi:IPT/TIG domain